MPAMPMGTKSSVGGETAVPNIVHKTLLSLHLFHHPASLLWYSQQVPDDLSSAPRLEA